jgi:hypothetical protein
VHTATFVVPCEGGSRGLQELVERLVPGDILAVAKSHQVAATLKPNADSSPAKIRRDSE